MFSIVNRYRQVLLALAALGVVSGSVRLGAVYAPIPYRERGAPIIVRTLLENGYDTNLFYENDAITEVDESWFTRLNPEIALNTSLTEQTFLQAQYSLDLLYYEDRPRDNTLANHYLAGSADTQFSERVQGGLDLEYRFVEDPPSRAETATPDFQERDRSFQQFFVGADASYLFNPRLRLGGAISFRDLSYDESEVARLLDRELFLLQGSATWVLGPQISLIGQIRYLENDFSNPGQILVPSAEPPFFGLLEYDRGSSSLFFLAGFDYTLSETTRINLLGGLERRSQNTPEIAGEDESSVFVEGSIERDLGERTLMQFELNYSTEPTDNLQQHKFEEIITLRGLLRHRFTSRIAATARLSYSDVTIEPIDGAELDPGVRVPEIVEDRLRLGLNLSYEPASDWLLFLSYNYSFWDSTSAPREWDKNRISLSLSYSFGLGR